MSMTLINDIKRKILLHGKIHHDMNFNRDVKELICHEETLTKQSIDEIAKTVQLNPKYQPELKCIYDWYYAHFPLYFNEEHRRHIVYHNNEDFDNRLQCISLFQILDDTMIVYQRSSDTSKMEDDFRFFVEILYRYFNDVSYIKIFYGSLHTTI